MDTSLLPRTYWRHVVAGPDGCWLWTGNLSPSGYGRWFGWGNKATPLVAHRVSYEALIGPIPEGLQLDHLCRVRRCVNPSHLEAVTCRENLLRSPHTQAGMNASKTHCVNGHEFTPENTYPQPRYGRTGRACRTCRREWKRRANDKLKQKRLDGLSGT